MIKRLKTKSGEELETYEPEVKPECCTEKKDNSYWGFVNGFTSTSLSILSTFAWVIIYSFLIVGSVSSILLLKIVSPDLFSRFIMPFINLFKFLGIVFYEYLIVVLTVTILLLIIGALVYILKKDKERIKVRREKFNEKITEEITNRVVDKLIAKEVIDRIKGKGIETRPPKRRRINK